jgi:hypothetical protein
MYYYSILYLQQMQIATMMHVHYDDDDNKDEDNMRFRLAS